MIRLAWRNIWRNKRRTLITAASIFLAVFFALVMRSIQSGTYGRIINNIVHTYTGYIQVHKTGYWNEQEINNSFPLNDTLISSLRNLQHVTEVIPRLESFALASSGAKTKGILVVGIDPAAEDRFSGLHQKIVNGRYLQDSDSGLLIAQAAAEYLGITSGDTLVLISQGYHGASAAGKWVVRGILHFTSPDLDKEMIYMPLPLAQSFYSANNNVTSLVLNLDDPDHLKGIMKDIRKAGIPDQYEVMSWDQMLVEVVQHIEADSVSGWIMIGILYMIIGFGIFGTILMMTAERIREFGVMASVGMQKAKLAMMIAIESVLIGFTGVVAGALAGFPLILYFTYHPIPLTGDYASSMEKFGYEALLNFEPPSWYFITNAAAVLGLIFLATIYPLRKILKMKVINALRNKV